MSFRLRLLLTWLVCLALPLQGYAAATMLNCAAAQAAFAHAAPVVDSAMEAMPCHPSADQPSDAANETLAAAATAKAKCSVCAAACVGMALPAGALRFAGPAPLQAPAATGAAAPADFIATGLERPPR